MTDKTISVYWFFILFIVAAAIVFLVYTLYGKPLDVREMEAIFLSEKVADCVSRGGKITPEGNLLISGGDISKICHLNFDVEEFKERWNDDQLFVSLNFFEGQNIISSVSSGNKNLEVNSNINFMESGKNKFPFCVDRVMFSNGEGEKYYSIKIIACVMKTEKNV